MKERYTIKRLVKTDEWAVQTISPAGEVTAVEIFGPRDGQAAVDFLTNLFALQSAAELAAVHRDQAQRLFDEENKKTEQEAVRQWWFRLTSDEQDRIFDRAVAYLGDGCNIPDCYHLYKTGKIGLEAVAV